MVPNTYENFHKSNPFLLQSQEFLMGPPTQAILMCPPTQVVLMHPQAQMQRFYEQKQKPYNYQILYQDNQIKLKNSLNYHYNHQIENTLDCSRNAKDSYSEFKQNIDFLETANDNNNNNNINKNDKNKIESGSKFIVFDLSTIKMLPPQEKVILTALKNNKRKYKRWTKEEDKLLCELIKRSELSWKEIASEFPTRTLKACQFRLSRLKNIRTMITKKNII